MDANLNRIKIEIYDKCELRISNFTMEAESEDYAACRFELNGSKIVSRNAKETPKKTGQFETFWKRNVDGIIEPLNESDTFDFYTVAVKKGKRLGQFIFPKSVLMKNGIVSTDKMEGKRGFRVYPVWDKTESKQAKQTQLWQLNYFYEINETIDLERVNNFFCRK